VRISAAGLALVLITIHVAPALAAPPDDAAVEARLAYVELALNRDEASIHAWRDTWISAFSALALVQVGVGAASTDTGVQGAALVGGVKSALAATSILISPASALKVTDTLSPFGGRTPRDRRERLHAAEKLLEASAAEARFRRSWIPLVAGVFLNLGGASVMWLGYKRPGSGWFGLGSGLVVGQVFYQTQPTGSIAAWAAYSTAVGQGKAPPSVASLVPKEPSIRWSVAPGAGGLVVQGLF
jgi:hypothetical protein